ncbi:MAG: alpha/beta hydrolase [Betaproteobacteria bacterium]
MRRRLPERRATARGVWLRAAIARSVAALLAGCLPVERLFFYPDARVYTTPAQFGLAHEDVWLTAADGSRLHAWWLPAKLQPALGTVLHLHGNAANVSNHLPLAAWLPAQGFNVLMLYYRGFGRSEGGPTLDGVVEDAQAALRALHARPGVDADRLIVIGHSLGAATALRLLAADSAGVRLAVLDAPFASYRGIARDAAGGTVLAPALPLALPALPDADKDPVTAAARLDLPLLILHGDADTVIPLHHSQQIAKAAKNAQSIVVPGAGHLQTFDDPRLRAQIVQAMQAALR